MKSDHVNLYLSREPESGCKMPHQAFHSLQEDDGGIASVHSGILASAAALNHDLEDHGILNALLTGAAVDRRAKEKHTAPQPPPIDDAVVAALAATPEVAAFMDADALKAIAGQSHCNASIMQALQWRLITS